MNILNVSSTLNDDTTLGDTSLANTVIDRIDMGVREVRGLFTPEMSGMDIEAVVDSLESAVRDRLLDVTILTMLETLVFIHDVTTHRNTIQFKNKQQDTWPNRVVLALALFTVCVAIYTVMRYIFVLHSNGIKTEGVIYEWLVRVFGWIKPWIF